MTFHMRSTFLFVPVVSLLFACGGGSDASSTTAVDSTAHAARGIRAMEDSLFAKPIFDRKGARGLYDVYMAFAKRNPLDSLTPEYLFRAAGVIRNLGEPQEGIVIYDRIIKNYPSWSRLVDAYYLKAFTYDNDLKMKGEAKTAYEDVIAHFPDHKFAAESRQMIDNLQYTDEQLIEKFRKMNEQASPDSGKGI